MTNCIIARIRHALAAFALLLPASLVWADMPVTYKDDGRSLFSVRAPDFWIVRTGGPRELAEKGSEDARSINRVVGMQPVTESGVWVGFISPHGVKSFAEAQEYLAEIGPFLVKDAIVDSRKKRRIGGLPAASIAGHGRRDGKSVNFTALIIDLRNGRMAISITILEAGADLDIVAEVNAIYSSFRATR